MALSEDFKHRDLMHKPRAKGRQPARSRRPANVDRLMAGASDAADAGSESLTEPASRA